MPERKTLERARRDAEEGKSPSTQAGEFVREEIEHIREGKHGARSTKQVIAIGLSKARRAGVPLPPPDAAKVSQETRKQAERDFAKGRKLTTNKQSAARSKAVTHALEREGDRAASSEALARHARESARIRGPKDLSKAARKAVRTKGKKGLKAAARKAARTRARNEGNRA